MSGTRDCWEKLRELADDGPADPRQAAAKIVRLFSADADADDLAMLRHRLEDTLDAGKYTEVPASYLNQHDRWLVVLDAACIAVRKGQLVSS